MNITGSISLNGQAIGTGKLDETTFNTYTSSYKVATTDFNNLTGSYNSFTTSYISDSSSFNARIGGLESFSSSLDTSFVSEVEFGNFSSSIKSYTSSLNSYTSSLENRLNVIDATTGSLNSYTSSTNGRLTSIESATSSLYSFTSSVNNRLATVETSTGSLNSFTSSINTTIKDKLNLDGVISGSSQVLNGSNIVSSSVQVTNYGFAITGSNLFKGTQTLSGSIIPSVDNTYDLGSADYQWRDVYISSGSLYIDGTKVISSTSQELQITTDNGQSIKILEGGTDSIILQTADGNIELKSNADGDILLDPTNGKIMLKGTVEILNGNKIQSSVGGTPVVFANDIVVSGSIDITGTIEGINLTDFSSSINTRLGNLESSGGNLNSFTASAIGRLNAIESTTSSLNSYTTSNNTRLDIIESTTSSLNSYTSSNNTRVSTIESTTASLNSFTSSANTKFSGIETVTGSFASYSGTTNGRLSAIETSTSSLNTHSSSTNNRLTSIESTTASLSSANTTQDGRITSLENKTGSYATTGSNIFQGNQTITGSLFVSENLIIAGSSSIQHISSSVVNIGDNIITVNAQNPSIRFGGIAVIDSGSSPQVSGSMLFDSTNNQWIFVHQNQGTVTSSVLLMGPETYNDLGGELYITQNRLVKSTGIEHLAASNISDNGTTVTMLSNTVVNGTFSATGTTLVSGSSQINHNATINYDTNQHVDHTAVSITAGSGLSGGGTIASTRTVTLDTGSVHFLDGVKKELNTEGVVSGSSQITYSGLSGIPSGIVSGSSQVLAGTTIHSGAFFNGISVVSGSAQISFGGITGVPSGLVSGSSQVSYTGLSNIPSGIVSGSSQVSYPSLSGIPGGIVSGSVQIDLTATTNYSTGIKTRLNAEGVISGSSQITGISNSQITNPSFFVGTTSISLGRASASQTLNGVSIDGNAATVTNGVYTTGDQTIAGVKTFSNKVVFNSAVANRPQFPGGILGIDTGDGNFDIWGISTEYYPSHATSTNAWGLRWNGNNNDFEFVGAGTNRVILDMDGGNITSTGTISASNFSGTSSGTNTGDQTNITGNAGTVTNGVYTTGNQTIGGTKTFSSTIVGSINGSAAQLDGQGQAYYFSKANMDAARNIVSGTNLDTDLENGGAYSSYGAGGTSWNAPFGYGGVIAYAFTSGIRAQFGFDIRHTASDYGDLWYRTKNNVGYSTWRKMWHDGNLTNLNQLTNGPGYITSDTTKLPLAGGTMSGTISFTNVTGNKVDFYHTTTGSGDRYGVQVQSSELRIHSGAGGADSGGITFGKSTTTTFTEHLRIRNDGIIQTVNVIKGASYFDAQASSGFRIRNSNDTANVGAFTRRGLWEGNGNYDPGLWAETGYGLYFYTNGSATIKTMITPNGTLLHGHTAVPTEGAWLGTAAFGRDGYGKVMCGSLNSTTTGAYVVGHNSALNDWADLNFGALNLIFRYQQTERARFDTSGHFIPGANSTYNLGSASLRWNTIFTSDLSLSNGIGDYTIVEGEEKLYLYNNKNNKVYSFVLQEEDPATATPKKL
jgi:hypothetical protein